MKKHFRYVSILTGAAITASTLAGCGQTAATTETTQTAPSAAYETESACEAPAEAAPAAPVHSSKSSVADAVSGIFSSGKNGDTAATESCYIEDGWYEPYCTEPYNTESYDKPDENGFFLSQGQPLSTFAADVDTASYANIRRMIGKEEVFIPSM